MQEPERIARSLWDAMNGRRWDDAAALLADGFEAWWPQSRMRYIGRRFIEMNQAYPGEGTIRVERAAPLSDHEAVTEVRIDWREPGRAEATLFAISFFELAAGKIWRLREYWADCYAPPAWQLEFGERRP